MRLLPPLVMHAALVLALLTAPQLANAQLPGLLWLQMKGWLVYTPDYLTSQGVTVTYASTQTVCFNGGGVPASDPNTNVNNQMRYYVNQAGVGSGLSFYIGSSAEPTTANPNKCVDLVSSTSASPNSANCNYRWRFGYYDMYSYMGEPGTAYWAGLYYTTGSAQVLNQFQQYTWNTSAGTTAFPRGYYYTINGLDTTRSLVVRMDVPSVPVHNDPNPLSKYMVTCEVQMYPQLPATTSRMPQPNFINGFKDLTWAQKYWWVIFLIVAIVLVILLIAIIVYCCITSVKAPEEEPLYTMVYRERVGKAYIVAEPARKASDEMRNQHEMQLQQEREAALRLGKGFNPQGQQPPPPQAVDPEDMSMGAAGIYGRNNRKQWGDGNVVENGDKQKSDGYFNDVATSGLGEEEKKEEEKPPEEDTASVAPSQAAAKKRSSRRSRGRTISNTFNDVDVPQAGEIDEINVDL